VRKGVHATDTIHARHFRILARALLLSSACHPGWL